MYNVPHFKASDEKEVIAFMHAHPFITLCGVDANNTPVATHVPCLMEERDDKIFLYAHVMRKQAHTKAFAENPNVLAIFQGAQAVHAKGLLRFLDDEGLYTLLTKLTETFENNPHSPSHVHKLDENYVTNNMKAITAFEVEVTSVEHVFKLSQNRDEKSYENIVRHLSEQDADAQTIAETMKQRQHKVFPS